MAKNKEDVEVLEDIEVTEKVYVAPSKKYLLQNGKQSQTIKLMGGYLNLLPNETLNVKHDNLTEDIFAKQKTGWLKLKEL